MTAETSKKARGTRACAWAKWLFIPGVVLLIAGLLAPSLGLSPMVAMLLISLGLLLFVVAAICGAIGLIRSGGSAGDSSAMFAWLGVAAGIAALINVSMTMSGAGVEAGSILRVRVAGAFRDLAEFAGNRFSPTQTHASASTTMPRVSSLSSQKSSKFALSSVTIAFCVDHFHSP